MANAFPVDDRHDRFLVCCAVGFSTEATQPDRSSTPFSFLGLDLSSFAFFSSIRQSTRTKSIQHSPGKALTSSIVIYFLFFLAEIAIILLYDGANSPFCCRESTAIPPHSKQTNEDVSCPTQDTARRARTRGRMGLLTVATRCLWLVRPSSEDPCHAESRSGLK